MSIRVNVAKIATILFFLSTICFGDSPAMSQEADQDSWSGLSVSVGAGIQNFDPNLDVDLFRRDRGRRNLQGPNFFGNSLQNGQASISETDWEAFGTAQIAFDQKVGNFLIGAFVDFDFGSDGENSYTITGIDRNNCRRGNQPRNCPIPADGIVGDLDIDYGNMWSVGGRAGFLMAPTWLIYGLVAYSEMSVDISARMIDPFPRNNRFRGDQPTNVSFDIDTLTGVTVGGGTEFEIAENLHFKLEYRYTEFDGEGASYSNFTFVGNGAHNQRITERLNVDLDSKVHSIRGAIVLKLSNLIN